MGGYFAHRCLRMSPEMFSWLAEKIRPLVQRQDTHLRRSIPVEERLSITLRHLATGEIKCRIEILYQLIRSIRNLKIVCRRNTRISVVSI